MKKQQTEFSRRFRRSLVTFLMCALMVSMFSSTILHKENYVAEAADSTSGVYMRYPGGMGKALTLAFDDGMALDEDLIDLFKKNGLKSTFYLNTGLYAPEGSKSNSSKRKLSESEATALYKDSGMEVGSHSRTHPDLTTFTDGNAVTNEAGLREEVLGDIQKIESQFGTKVYGIAYPGAPPYLIHNPAIVEWLKNNGVGYARTPSSSLSFKLPKDWLVWDPTCHYRSEKFYELTQSFLSKLVVTDPMLYFVWGHAYEFTDYNEWDVIRNFAQQVRNVKNVWYATNGEVYTYVTDYNKLQISSAEDTIVNPTARSLWFSYKGTSYEIKAGATIKGVFAGTYKVESSAVSSSKKVSSKASTGTSSPKVSSKTTAGSTSITKATSSEDSVSEVKTGTQSKDKSSSDIKTDTKPDKSNTLLWVILSAVLFIGLAVWGFVIYSFYRNKKNKDQDGDKA